jgi:hypothetical protein
MDLENIQKLTWQCVFVILLGTCNYLVMKTEHTVASYNSKDFTGKINVVQDLCEVLYLTTNYVQNFPRLTIIFYILIFP